MPVDDTNDATLTAVLNTEGGGGVAVGGWERIRFAVPDLSNLPTPTLPVYSQDIHSRSAISSRPMRIRLRARNREIRRIRVQRFDGSSALQFACHVPQLRAQPFRRDNEIILFFHAIFRERHVLFPVALCHARNRVPEYVPYPFISLVFSNNDPTNSPRKISISELKLCPMLSSASNFPQLRPAHSRT